MRSAVSRSSSARPCGALRCVDRCCPSAAFAPCSANYHELNFGHCVAADDPYQIGAMRFAELVETYTSKQVKINVFPGCQLGGGDRELIEGVKLGTVNIMIGASAPIGGFEPRFMLFDLPFLFRDNAHAHKALDGHATS